MVLVSLALSYPRDPTTFIKKLSPREADQEEDSSSGETTRILAKKKKINVKSVSRKEESTLKYIEILENN